MTLGLVDHVIECFQKGAWGHQSLMGNAKRQEYSERNHLDAAMPTHWRHCSRECGSFPRREHVAWEMAMLSGTSESKECVSNGLGFGVQLILWKFAPKFPSHWYPCPSAYGVRKCLIRRASHYFARKPLAIGTPETFVPT